MLTDNGHHTTTTFAEGVRISCEPTSRPSSSSRKRAGLLVAAPSSFTLSPSSRVLEIWRQDTIFTSSCHAALLLWQKQFDLCILINKPLSRRISVEDDLRLIFFEDCIKLSLTFATPFCNWWTRLAIEKSFIQISLEGAVLALLEVHNKAN